MSAVERALHRERWIVIAGLCALTLLAWIYLWQGAGMGMTALAMTKLALFPHLTPEPMPDMVMPAISWLTVVVMWWIMMIAMMTPSAAPLVLLYARVVRHAAQTQREAAYIPTVFLAAGYLLTWLGFSLLAALLQAILARTGLISEMMLWSQSAWLSAMVLAAAGIYQFTPLKYACLKHCRGPAHFLAQHMRQGKLGALRMGFDHGVWCVGCCWVLMLLLFVGGVMNVAWIAVLTVLVLLEKLTTNGAVIGRAVGMLLIGWGAVTLLV